MALTLSSPSDLFTRIARQCRERGMNLVGAIAAGEFDATQPRGRRVNERRDTCGTVLLLASGGTSGWESVLKDEGGRLGEPRPGYHPIDDWSVRIAQEVVATLRDAGFEAEACYPDDRRALNFRQLAEQCGLGTVSPVLGHLLHPEFGPWVSLRAAILVDGLPFGASPSPPLEFEPCTRCSRPCVTACPAHIDSDACGRPRVEDCAVFRVDGGCNDGCPTLRACPIGATHRYGREEERFRGAYAGFAMRRWLGAGAWKLVPKFLRRR